MSNAIKRVEDLIVLIQKSRTAQNIVFDDTFTQICTKYNSKYEKSRFLYFYVAVLVYALYYLCGFINSGSKDCIFAMPKVLNDAFRPPIDCDFCRGVEKVPKLNKISQEEFENNFAYSGVPVVVQDATDTWLATKKFNFEFFKNLYASTSNSRTSRDCQFFPYETEFENLEQVFNMSKERSELKPGTRPWYIGWSNCQDAAAVELRSLYSRPYFLPKTSGEPTATDWIFMGGPGKGAHLHLDNVHNPSWQAQIKGTKRWTIIPPPECYFQCSGEIIIDVYPGEIIVLDTDIWFHQTEILPGDISITIGAEYD